jgi:hypothetical protein
VSLPLTTRAEERDTAAGRARRALSRALFDATADAEPLDLFHPSTPEGKRSFQMLTVRGRFHRWRGPF